MAKLIYSAIMSIDGYVADTDGNFDWAAPDPQVHAFVNDVERPIGTYLYGRKMYDVMAAWENPDAFDDDSAVTRDYAAIWQAADKIVYSRSTVSVTTRRTRAEPVFGPAAIRDLKDRAEQDISVGGPNLAAQAIRAGLVDEYRLFVTPVIVGGGNPALPSGAVVGLTLTEQRRFDGGVVYLAYTSAESTHLADG